MAKITFVDKDDNIIGYGTKDEAIAQGIIHRIARVLVFNETGDILIQQRSNKVKIAGRWDSSAAGHVDEGENYLVAAAREAQEEVGVDSALLSEVGKFYAEETDDNITKKRYTSLFTTLYNGEVHQDNDEVSAIKWISPADLAEWMSTKPEDFTQGFLQAYQYYLASLR